MLARPNEAEAPANVPTVFSGVSLRGLLERARRRGMVSLPPFITVKLVQHLCQGLQHVNEPGGVSLDSVTVGSDGKVWVKSGDVVAAGVVLDQLLGETNDPELVRIIGETKLPDATALSLEQRLGHWLVKQHQLFPRADLLAELVSWLFPGEVKTAPSEQVAAWLQEQCTGPVLEEPRALPSPATRWWPVALALLAVAVGATALVITSEQHPVSTPEPRLPPVATTPRPAPPAVLEPPRAAPDTLPRWGEGVPVLVKLSSIVHGIELETAGFGVSGPAPRWAVKTVSSVPKAAPPGYASLFVVDFDGNHRSVLRQVTTSWLVLTRPEARFFAMQTDQPPHDGSFGLAFALAPAQPGSPQFTELPKLRRPNVMTDAMTGLEYRRFVLSGLNPKKSYVIAQQGSAPPPVVVTATIPHGVARDLTGAGFMQRRAPLDQVLLQGVPVTVKGASRLSFVVLTTKGAPEQLTSVEVKEATQPRGRAPIREEAPLVEPVKRLLEEGRDAMASGDYAQAKSLFQQCVRMDQSALDCRQMITEAVAAQELETRKKRAR
jgi:hypothetical protein